MDHVDQSRERTSNHLQFATGDDDDQSKIETKLGANQLIFRYSLITCLSTCFFFVIIIIVAVFIAKKANNIPVLALSSSNSLPDVVKIFKVFFTSSSSLTICRHHRASPETGIFKSSYFTFHFKCTSLARDAIYMLILPFPSSLSLRLLPTSVYAHGVCLSSLVMMEIALISRILLSANRKLMWLIFRLFFSLCMYIKRTHT